MNATADGELKSEKIGWGRRALLVVGVGFSLWLLLVADLKPGQPAVSRTAAVAVLMATLWLTEVIPLAVTALLPVVLFPLLGIEDGQSVSKEYFSHVIFLFIGGFIVALAMERWNLHRRIALRTLLIFGTQPHSLLWGFMLATAVLSMWISNTAATMMMVTIAAAILRTMEGSAAGVSRNMSIALLLGVAYGASIGGISTLVGTPPNMVLVGFFAEHFPDAPQISFTSWLLTALPISIILLVITWLALCVIFLRGAQRSISRDALRQQYRQLGPLGYCEAVVMCDFLVLVLLWVFRADLDLGIALIPGWDNLLPEPSMANDGTVAIAMAVLLFFVPARTTAGQKVMDWQTAAKLPWHIVLLFGGGFALAAGIMNSGLSVWLGEQLQGLQHLHPLLLLFVICFVITFLTELTSNLATTQTVLPIMASLALAIEVHPLFLMIPVTICCSCAFMMPVATPPNAIVFGTGRLRIADMVRAGLLLNLISVVTVVGITYLRLPAIWDADMQSPPEWATVIEKVQEPPVR